MRLVSYYFARRRNNITKSYTYGNVLDIGCGNSEILTEFRNIKDYCGIDIDQKTIDKLSIYYPQNTFVCADLDEDNLQLNSKFDVVIMTAIIEHIYNQKFLFKQIVKYLKKGGIILITTPTPFGDFIHNIGAQMGIFSKVAIDEHIIIYNQRRFKVLARKFKLKLIKYKTFEFGCNQLVILQK